MDINKLREITNILFANSGIKIKPENRGKFTQYCGGEVTEDCIRRGKNSPDPAIRKRATFAANARVWKHQTGGKFGSLFTNYVAQTIHDPDLNTDTDLSQSNWWSSIPLDFQDDSEKTSDTKTLDKTITKSAFGYIPNIPIISALSTGQFSTAFGNYGAKQATADYIRNYLSEKLNITPEQAEGFVVNFFTESGFNPTAVAAASESGGKKFSGGDSGLAQWTGDRKRAFKSWSGGIDITKATLTQQLEYVVYEMKHKFKNTFNRLRQANNSIDAAKIVHLGYEATSDDPDVSDRAFYDVYRKDKNESLLARLRKAGYK